MAPVELLADLLDSLVSLIRHGFTLVQEEVASVLGQSSLGPLILYVHSQFLQYFRKHITPVEFHPDVVKPISFKGVQSLDALEHPEEQLVLEAFVHGYCFA